MTSTPVESILENRLRAVVRLHYGPAAAGVGRDGELHDVYVSMLAENTTQQRFALDYFKLRA